MLLSAQKTLESYCSINPYVVIYSASAEINIKLLGNIQIMWLTDFIPNKLLKGRGSFPAEVKFNLIAWTGRDIDSLLTN